MLLELEDTVSTALDSSPLHLKQTMTWVFSYHRFRS